MALRSNFLGSSLCPFAFRDDLEGRGACVPMVGNKVSWSPTLQRRITVEAGRSVMSTIFKGEGSGPAGEECEPCKTFHVSVPGSGTLVVRLMAEAAGSGLQLVVPYSGFRPDDGSLPVTRGDIVAYVKGTAVLPARFEVSTNFRPGS